MLYYTDERCAPLRGTVTDINRNLAAALKSCGPAVLNDENVVNQVTANVISIIRKQHPCQQDLGDDEDFESLEESSEYDWLVIDTALDVIIGLATALGPTFGELWKIFEKPIMKFAASSETIERSTSVGVIAEAVNCMGPAITPYTTVSRPCVIHLQPHPANSLPTDATEAPLAPPLRPRQRGQIQRCLRHRSPLQAHDIHRRDHAGLPDYPLETRTPLATGRSATDRQFRRLRLADDHGAPGVRPDRGRAARADGAAAAEGRLRRERGGVGHDREAVPDQQRDDAAADAERDQPAGEGAVGAAGPADGRAARGAEGAGQVSAWEEQRACRGRGGADGDRQ